MGSQDNEERGIRLANCDNDEIEDCRCLLNGLSGIYVETCTWVKLINIICNTNGRSGINLSGSDDCSIIAPTCNGNDSGDTDTYDGITLSASDRTVIVGAQCDANDRHGLYIYESSNCSVTGGQYNNNGRDGIHIGGDDPNADYNTVTGVVATGNASDGIEISEVAPGDANKNIIVACQLLANTGAALTDGGTDTEIGHNITV